MTKRYQSLPNHKGIRKDNKSNKYVAAKSINGLRFSKTFSLLRDAILWQKTFVPDELASEQRRPKAEVVQEEASEAPEKTFGDVLDRYFNEHLPCLGLSTRQNRKGMMEFFEGLREVSLSKFTPEIVSGHLLEEKKRVLKIGHKRRCSFDHELKVLKSICNWYAEEDYTFRNPVLKRHRLLGQIREPDQKRLKMKREEFNRFLGALMERPFWYDFALVHFFCAGRVQEIAGLQIESVDFENAQLLIKDVVVWDKSTKKLAELKTLPKNGESRYVYLNEAMAGALRRQIGDRTSGFVFRSPSGEALTYREIQYNYACALKDAELDHEFSGTHFVRHSMATITRLATGSLDATQSVTGHKDQGLVQQYAELDLSLNREAILKVESFMGYPQIGSTNREQFEQRRSNECS